MTHKKQLEFLRYVLAPQYLVSKLLTGLN